MRKIIVAMALVAVLALALASSALGYGSPIDGCHHSPTPQLCAR